MTNRHAILLALTLIGCPKSGFDPDSSTDTFKEGVRLLGEMGLSFDAWSYHPQVPKTMK